MPLRLASYCGLLVPLTYGAALLAGGLVQREGFSSADDSTSDLGADTASSPWIYNRIGTNLTGLLIVLFALGLWRSLSPSVLGRIAAVFSSKGSFRWTARGSTRRARTRRGSRKATGG